MSSRVHPAHRDDLIGAQPVLHASTDFSSSPDLDDKKAANKSETSSLYDVKAAPPLADAGAVAPSAGQWFLETFNMRKKSKIRDLDAIATQESVYDGPLASLYRPIPKWENLAYFDPAFRWTYREERTVIRKVDLKLLAWIMFMFFALDIDRGNLANGTADNLLDDLGLTQADYNLDTKFELPIRMAFFYTINAFTSLVTAFLAVGLCKMRGVGGYAGWRWMFLIEGLFTLLVGIASFFMLPPGPSQTKAKWRPNGYFTDNEVKIIVNRVVRDDPGKATMHNRQVLSFKLLWRSLCDYDLWPMYLMSLVFNLPAVPLSNYFQLSMKRLGFSTVKANLLAVPSTVISILNLILISIFSEFVDSRTWVCSVEQWWFLPFFVALRVLKDPGPWVYFALATLVLGYPYVHSLQVAWCSRNAGSVRTRTVGASLYNMFIQASSIIGANIYQADDSPPFYPRGNSILLGIIAFNLVVTYPFTYFYYRWRNAQKEKVWSAMSTAEKAHYLATTKDEGNRKLDFRFAY
ncbi:hypothetical protein JCM8547_001900 [Rhodosporidiobolus lusitaniae]